MNKLIQILSMLFLLMLSTFDAYSACINEINNETDLLRSNICTYEFTVIATINRVSLKDKYNPITYFNNHRTYRFDALVEELIKGNVNDKICFLQWREKPYGNVYKMETETYIISFNKNEDCSVLEVGAILKSSQALLKIAREYQAN